MPEQTSADRKRPDRQRPPAADGRAVSQRREVGGPDAALLALLADPTAPGLQPLIARHIRALQATHGNQYVQRLFTESARSSDGGRPRSRTETKPPAQHQVSEEEARPDDTSNLQSASNNDPVPRLVQAKLIVGPAGDSHEQEANRVAEQVMRMPAPASSQRPAHSAQHPVRRQTEYEEVEA